MNKFNVLTIFVKLNYYLAVKMASFFLKELLMELLQNQNHLEESQLELLELFFFKEKKNIYSSHFVIHKC